MRLDCCVDPGFRVLLLASRGSSPLARGRTAEHQKGVYIHHGDLSHHVRPALHRSVARRSPLPQGSAKRLRTALCCSLTLSWSGPCCGASLPAGDRTCTRRSCSGAARSRRCCRKQQPCRRSRGWSCLCRSLAPISGIKRGDTSTITSTCGKVLSSLSTRGCLFCDGAKPYLLCLSHEAAVDPGGIMGQT